MMALERHAEQLVHWPKSGKHVLAQFDDETVIVYQAYKPSIGHHAAKHQKFGGGFSFERMSWIKPNFLWMMYRSGWIRITVPAASRSSGARSSSDCAAGRCAS